MSTRTIDSRSQLERRRSAWRIVRREFTKLLEVLPCAVRPVTRTC